MVDILDFADIIGPGGKGLEGEDNDLDLSEDDDFGLSEASTDEDESLDGSGSDAETAGGDEEAEGTEDDEDAEDDENAEDVDVKNERDDVVLPAPNSVATPATSDPPQKYIPPHMRAAALAEKAAGDVKKVEERRKLDRKVQGCLNK